MSKTNAINRGRDYYRAEQMLCRRLLQRRRYPEPAGIDLDTTEVVQLGKQKYRREKVENKAYFAGVDAAGKDIMIPYQTCTLVKVREA